MLKKIKKIKPIRLRNTLVSFNITITHSPDVTLATHKTMTFAVRLSYT